MVHGSWSKRKLAAAVLDNELDHDTQMNRGGIANCFSALSLQPVEYLDSDLLMDSGVSNPNESWDVPWGNACIAS